MPLRLDDSFLFNDGEVKQEPRLDDSFLFADEKQEPEKTKSPPENKDTNLTLPDGTPKASMVPYKPTYFEQVTNYFTDTDADKARASNELAARKIAERENIPVRDVYESVGATRPDSEVDGPGRLQTAAGKLTQGIGGIVSSTLKGAAINRQATARDFISGMESLLSDSKPTGRQVLAVGGMATNVLDMKKAEKEGDTERADYLRGVIYKEMDAARKLIEEDPTQAPLYKTGDKVDQSLKDFIKTNPEFEDDFFTSKVSHGLGTMITFAGAAALGKGAFTKVGLPGVVSTTAPVASVGAIMQYTSGFEDALNSGADFETSLQSAERNLPLGFTEALPIASLFNRLDKGSGGLLKRSVVNAMKSGTEEALQETFQSVMSNAIAQDLYDKDRGLWKGAGEGAGVGFTTGGIVAFLGTLIGGRRSAKKPEVSKPEKEVDQQDQPTELFNPTHKASGGIDVQIATKNGKIIPDTYIDQDGNTVRDANAVANDPDVSIDVTNDVSAVVEQIKSEIAGKQTGKETTSTLSTAEETIQTLEQQNQGAIDAAFAAPAPEIANQGIINSQIFDKTAQQMRQDEINQNFPTDPDRGQQGVAPEVPVTQQEINQKRINSIAAAKLSEVPTKSPTEEQLNTEFLSSIDRNNDAIKIAADAVALDLENKNKKIALKSASVEVESARKKLIKENDTIGKMLAKSGGLNREEMASQGVDPESLKSKATVFGKPLFPKNGGMTSDQMAELLNQQGYRGGNLTANDALDIVFETLSGDTKFVNEDVEAQVNDLGRQSDNIQQELERIESLKPERFVKKEAITKAKDVDIAANQAATSLTNNLLEPTDAQKSAGNYKKGQTNVQGFDIAIENPAGSKRRPEWPTLKQHYGYIKRTVGADSEPGATGNKIEQVDVFVNPSKDIAADNPVFIIDQAKADGSDFDEHKVMMGFNGEEDARSSYLENYTKGWKGLNQITKATPAEFKEWLDNGDTSLEYGKHPEYSKSVSPETKSKVVPDVSPVKPSKQKVIKNERQNELQDRPQDKPLTKRPDEVQGKIEEKTQRDNRVSNELPDKPPVKISDPYQDMRGKDIQYQVDVEETGETYTVTVDAGKTMDDLDTRIDALNKLRDCI